MVYFPTDLSEAEFLDHVVELAKLHGWLCWHSIPAQVRKGRWVTPGKGDTGFPDLCMAHADHGTVFAELKVGYNKPSDKQLDWINTLNDSGTRAFIWWPKDIDQIVDVLQGRHK